MAVLMSCLKICTKKQCGPQVASFYALEVLNLMAIDLPKLWQPAKNVDLVSGKLPVLTIQINQSYSKIIEGNKMQI